ncbi:MAG: hypothetical protein CMG67_01300 [Candidatus Marinimicrobia bacterium]|nr:hypothetical protein [Candidatus Neomarinimicrobiota bacterium]|tara:strand:+ start:2655 stop:3179 length:525 start_codon:yes stop_codon:yes gene_type:complete
MTRNLRNMKAGNLKFNCLILLFLTIFTFKSIYAEEKINLNILQPTFEEEQEADEKIMSEPSNIKSKKKKLKTKSNDSVVKFRALDKITAKTKDINITIGKKKKFGYLEIFPRKCNKFQDQNKQGVAAYIQVRDLSDKKEDKVFVFNGWTFSSSTNLRVFDHPIYDLWVIGCDNI